MHVQEQPAWTMRRRGGCGPVKRSPALKRMKPLARTSMKPRSEVSMKSPKPVPVQPQDPTTLAPRLAQGPKIPVRPRRAKTAAAKRYEREFEKTRKLVMERAGGQCEARFAVMCELAYGWNCHHRKMRSQGGGNELENLLAVCDECHRLIHARPEDAYARGLLLHAGDDPAAIPVRRSEAA